MSITAITSEHLADCAELYKTVFNKSPWSENWTRAKAIERLNFYFDTPNFIGFQFHKDNVLQGFVLGNYEPNQDEYLYLLQEICVHPNFQHQGIGSELVSTLHANLDQLGITTVNLITQLSGLAANFYQKHGYYQSIKMGLYVFRFTK